METWVLLRDIFFNWTKAKTLVIYLFDCFVSIYSFDVLILVNPGLCLSAGDHLFSLFTKLSEKLTILTPLRTRTWAYQGEKNVSLSENFANALNEWSRSSLSTIFYWVSRFLIPSWWIGNIPTQSAITCSKLAIETMFVKTYNLMRSDLWLSDSRKSNTKL